MTVNKVEFAGISVSVLAMAGALWFMQLDNPPQQVAEDESATQTSSPVTVAAGGDQQAALARAVTDAADSRGALERLVIDDISLGEGPAVAEGDTVRVHYIGRLQNGQEFDNSYNRGEAFSFTVGDGEVIPGWDQGVVGMQTGGKRILVVPPQLAYGEDGRGPIPADATLIFAIELLEIVE